MLQVDALLVARSPWSGLLQAMPTMRAPFVQPPSVHTIRYSPVTLGMVPLASISHAVDSSNRVIAAHCHAPPLCSSPPLTPLRV